MPIKKRSGVRLSPAQELKLKLIALCNGPILDPQGHRHLVGEDGPSIILVYPEANEREHPSQYIGNFDSETEAREWAKEHLKKRKFIVVPMDDPYDLEKETDNGNS